MKTIADRPSRTGKRPRGKLKTGDEHFVGRTTRRRVSKYVFSNNIHTHTLVNASVYAAAVHWVVVIFYSSPTRPSSACAHRAILVIIMRRRRRRRRRRLLLKVMTRARVYI